MSALSPDDARRMRGILGRLLSDHDGERLAAVDALIKLCGKAGMSVCDLAPQPASEAVMVPFNPKAARRAMYPERAGPPERGEITREHQRTALRLLWSATEWSEREAEFLSSMTERRDQPTDRQSAWLRDLEGKARRQRARRDAVNA